MRIFDIDGFKRGWFVGNFYPVVFQSNEIEIAHHTHLKGEVSVPHYHPSSTELSYIVRGKAYVSGEVIEEGSGWVYGPCEDSDVIFLEDTDLIVVRTPSIDDKVLGKYGDKEL